MPWELNGIIGRNEKPPAVAGTCTGLAAVLATGRTVWDDLLRFDPVARKASVVAVNNMILHWKERVHHGVSLHVEEPPLWRSLRPCYSCDGAYVQTHTYTSGRPSKCDFEWDVERSRGGTSTLLAVMIGLGIGYDRIVLCGAPLDGKGHFYDPPGRDMTPEFTQDFVKNEWTDCRDSFFKGRVRSMSGWTRELLGEPDEAWLRR
jgi:hypothetical protein